MKEVQSTGIWYQQAGWQLPDGPGQRAGADLKTLQQHTAAGGFQLSILLRMSIRDPTPRGAMAAEAFPGDN